MSTIPDNLMKVPFLTCGRTEAGADCYGWARLVALQAFGKTLPLYPVTDYDALSEQSCSQALRKHVGDWPAVRAGAEQAGDLVLLVRKNRPSHVGVVIGDGFMVHLEAPVRAGIAAFPCRESYREGRWAHRVAAFLRWEEAAS